ncbi:hypothetical protein LCGC14_1648790 [marine sediment metagenome]|uniref:HNH nuclease domain-containing protein n=1 Tax=marine sediment metagenome TaxID=412755 RepID=A0A0F9HXF0_9ZZZZ
MDKEEPQNCKKNPKSLDRKDIYLQLDDEILYYNQDNDSLTLAKSEEEKSIIINKLKESIKNFEWDKISDDWSIVHLPRYRAQYETIILDPKQNCSRTNPLYKHRQWLEFIYNNEKLKLTDLIIAQTCEVTTSTINRWRKKLNIPTKVGNGRWIHEGRVNLYMPKEYQHPDIISNKKGVIRYEHVVVMERYLSGHPELGISKKCLVEGKYLKRGCIVHHINYNPQDNRIENLWVFENHTEHNLSGKTLYSCFSDFIKLNQIFFKNGKYYLNRHFNFKDLSLLEIKKKVLKSKAIIPYKDINLVKEAIKKIDWDSFSDDWTVKYYPTSRTPYKTILLNPYLDCTNENPLYRHKEWVKRLVYDKEFNLTDSRLGKICGIPKSKALYWRERVHNIYTRAKLRGFKRYLKKEGTKEIILIRVPEDYANPFAEKNRGFMREHRYILERYLAEHPELEISRKYLFDDKYLKSTCVVHHINFDSNDNRLENLWVCENGYEHQLIESSLLTFVDELLKSKLIVFRKGEYSLDC